MQLHVSADPALEAAAFIADTVTEDSVVGVATGRTPITLYSALAQLQFSTPRAGFALDEYVGLSARDPGSFANYVAKLIEPAFKMPAGSIAVPRGDAPDPHAEADRYEAAIKADPIALQILGVGTNGHVAFNEPGSLADSLTRVVRLTEQTRADNAADVTGSVPELAITQGVATISRAGVLCLLATGESKAAAIAKLVAGEPDALWPVSLLAGHPNLQVFIDPAAASALAA